jgi:hypothetical protein
VNLTAGEKRGHWLKLSANKQQLSAISGQLSAKIIKNQPLNYSKWKRILNSSYMKHPRTAWVDRQVSGQLRFIIAL